MNHLVDANVLSEATKSAPAAKVVDWLKRHEAELAVDPIILGEIRFGILLLPDGKRRQRLLRWFKQGVAKLTCLPWGPRPVYAGRSCSLICAPLVRRCRSRTA